MLRSLGSTEQITLNHPCCDVCNNNSIPVKLHFEALLSDPSTRKRSTRHTVFRKVNKDFVARLKDNLKLEREAYIKEHSSFRMLGADFVCADSAIDKICLDSKFISSIEDLDVIVSIRPEIKSRFLTVIAT